MVQSLNEETGVATIILNTPETLNALTVTQMWEYMFILQHAEKDDRVKVLFWTAHGRAFSSGADLSGKAPPPVIPADVKQYFIDNDFKPGATVPNDITDIALKCLTLRFWDFTKLSVVAVNGLAVITAVGTTRIAHRSAL